MTNRHPYRCQDSAKVLEKQMRLLGRAFLDPSLNPTSSRKKSPSLADNLVDSRWHSDELLDRMIETSSRLRLRWIKESQQFASFRENRSYSILTLIREQNYDVSLLHSGARAQIEHQSSTGITGTPVTDSAKEAEETGTSPFPSLPVVPFWRTKVGRIMIGTLVAAILIIALVGGSLGAAAAATVNRDRKLQPTEAPDSKPASTLTFSSSLTVKPASSTLPTSSSQTSTSTTVTSPVSTGGPISVVPITAPVAPTG
jgi:hypothetical protein